jgi:hypothetical protein
VRIHTGKAFDIVVEYKRLSLHYLEEDRSRGSVATYEVEVRNRKLAPVELLLLDYQYTSPDVESTIEMVRPDASTLQWKLNLKPNETLKFRYTVKNRTGV